jgi:hypothetical protein
MRPRPLIEPEIWREVALVTVRGRPHSPTVGALVREAMRMTRIGQPALAVQAARSILDENDMEGEESHSAEQERSDTCEKHSPAGGANRAMPDTTAAQCCRPMMQPSMNIITCRPSYSLSLRR